MINLGNSEAIQSLVDAIYGKDTSGTTSIFLQGFKHGYVLSKRVDLDKRLLAGMRMEVKSDHYERPLQLGNGFGLFMGLIQWRLSELVEDENLFAIVVDAAASLKRFKHNHAKKLVKEHSRKVMEGAGAIYKCM